MSLGRGGNDGFHESGGGANGCSVMTLDEDDGEDMIQPHVSEPKLAPSPRSRRLIHNYVLSARVSRPPEAPISPPCLLTAF